MRAFSTMAAMPLLLMALVAGSAMKTASADPGPKLAAEAGPAPAAQRRDVFMTKAFAQERAEIQAQFVGNRHFTYPILVMYAEATPRSAGFSRLAIVMFDDYGGPAGNTTDLFLKERKGGAWRMVTPTDVSAKGEAFRSGNSWKVTGIDRATGLPTFYLPPNQPMGWSSVDMRFDPAVGRYVNVQ